VRVRDQPAGERVALPRRFVEPTRWGGPVGSPPPLGRRRAQPIARPAPSPHEPPPAAKRSRREVFPRRSTWMRRVRSSHAAESRRTKSLWLMSRRPLTASLSQLAKWRAPSPSGAVSSARSSRRTCSLPRRAHCPGICRPPLTRFGSPRSLVQQAANGHGDCWPFRLGRSDRAVVTRLRRLGLRAGRWRSPHHPTPTRGHLTPGERALVERELHARGSRAVPSLERRLERPLDRRKPHRQRQQGRPHNAVGVP